MRLLAVGLGSDEDVDAELEARGLMDDLVAAVLAQPRLCILNGDLMAP
jgi:hypothetical protein